MKYNYKSVKNLLLILLTGFSLTMNAQNAWINEIHYDNTGTDAGEFIEVVIESASSYNLTDFSVILYNGSDSKLYNTKTLNLFTSGATTGNFSLFHFVYPANGIQNGAPDGMALVYMGSLISGQFLSYEGTLTAIDGAAAGMTSVDIGVLEVGTEPLGLSLQLSGSGGMYSSFTWQAPATATAGALNNGQTLSTGGVENPENFNAITFSQTQINLSWLQNSNLDDVMIATNTTNSFGTPSGTYEVNDLIGTATVIYNGPLTSFNHSGLLTATEHFYKAWSVDGSTNYSPGVVDSATTQFLEPTSHPTGLLATSNGPVFITVSWTDSDAAHYLVKGSTIGYENIVPPVDGVGQGDSLLVKNVDASILSHQFTGLTPNTQYYFKIWPYNGGDESSNYKTDGTVPGATATTDELDIDLIISEVADPIQFNMRFVELYNPGTTTIDFANDIVHFCRQSNGVPGSWASVQLAGTLPAGETYVIAYQASYFDTAYSQTAETYNSLTVNNNGNDGVFLYYGGNQTTGYMFDAYGSINVDGENEPWNYADGHSVRKRTVTSPSNTWTTGEWAIVRNLNYKNMTPGMHAEDVTWQGTTSTGWNTRGNNWNGLYGWIPDASCNVTIPNVTNFPIVTEPSACHQVQIHSGSTLSVQSTGSLLIVGP